MARKSEPRLSDLMSVPQAADVLGVSVPALHMAIARKKLHAHRIGSHLILDRFEVERYGKENSRK